jgi:hypothetical protein
MGLGKFNFEKEQSTCINHDFKTIKMKTLLIHVFCCLMQGNYAQGVLPEEWGLNAYQINDSQLVNASEYYGSGAKQFGLANYFYYRLGGQHEIIRNLFIQAHFNYLSTEYPIKWIYPDADIGKLGIRISRYGYAGSLGFKPPLGPIAVAVTKDVYDKEMQASLMIGFVYKGREVLSKYSSESRFF